MAIKETLDRILECHPDLIGAMVASNGQYIHNLEPPYDMVTVNEVMDLFAEMLGQTDVLADEGFDFSEMMIDFPGHTFVVRKIDESVLLAVLAPRMAREHLMRLQVGFSLFGKSIQKAIAEEEEKAAAAAEAPTDSTLGYPELPEAVRLVDPSELEAISTRPISRPRKGFRGRGFYSKNV